MQIIAKRVVFVLGLMAHFVAMSQKTTVPKSIVVYKTQESINVDGMAKEAAWGNAMISDGFMDIEGVTVPTYRTNVRMLWDEEYLYFFAELEEPHVWATLDQRDTVIFYNNDFEIFIDPDGDTHNYYEFEMNALNTVWDLLLVKPYREQGPIVDSWDILGLKTAVKVNGTLNDPSDVDKGWNVEIAMPWSVLTETSESNEVPKGKFWRINFSRVNWDFQLENGKYGRKKDSDGKYLPEHNWVWSPQGVINMHEPEHWGYAYFSPRVAGNHDEFSIPRDEEIRWMLYRFYREQKKFFAKNGMYASKLEDLGEEPILSDGTKIELEMELHRTGWNIWAKSPFTGILYTIREDGKYQHNIN
ncbi:carbohydrate-binding family 9-like protein [Flagellimonas aequoris]|uniref:Carbohydrate-binding family 9-like protein n=1 Tax=Flagellimonas aequoris TaxID=2306997 RepID=A0A418N7U3_9FLAO|nr:carbohydrate-binding family 9-like protein [Allomuricauda aequoris]RIV71166.1 carbohydrate-binding family 9-like protein [Allomuricauda aequoris]TXK02539.1 carbohydrate-binding family 9-like protein [Allomuricauda aequoris]